MCSLDACPVVPVHGEWATRARNRPSSACLEQRLRATTAGNTQSSPFVGTSTGTAKGTTQHYLQVPNFSVSTLHSLLVRRVAVKAKNNTTRADSTCFWFSAPPRLLPLRPRYGISVYISRPSGPTVCRYLHNRYVAVHSYGAGSGLQHSSCGTGTAETKTKIITKKPKKIKIKNIHRDSLRTAHYDQHEHKHEHDTVCPGDSRLLLEIDSFPMQTHQKENVREGDIRNTPYRPSEIHLHCML